MEQTDQMEAQAIAEESPSEQLEFISSAELFLGRLRTSGITRFFVNGGTDFAPIAEAYARFGEVGEAAFPRLFIAAHENVVMGMAHGAYLMSGRPQATMFHVGVGTANAVCGALNAAAENVPIVICAGRSPIFEEGKLGARNTRVTWAQELFDQASLIRSAVKWEYELRGAAHAESVVDRALTIASAEPKGPVYLSLPREALAEPSAIAATASVPAAPTSSYPDPAVIAELADRLITAEFAVISSLASGAEPKAVPLLAELCDRFAIGYVEEQARYLNMPSDHVLHLGYEQSAVLAEADTLLFVESDVPWIPEKARPRDDAFIAQAGADPHFGRYPMRSHRADLAVQSGPVALFTALLSALQARQARLPAGRHARIAARSQAYRLRTKERADNVLRGGGAIDKPFISATLASLLHDGCVIFNEYWGDRSLLSPIVPSSYFYLPATGGLGWALPAAAGAKLEAPARTMVALVGDGTYMFSNPIASHHAIQKHGCPVLTVIANDSRWNAVDTTSRLVYPDGHVSRMDRMEISDLSPSPDYRMIVEACGGFGAVVQERSALRETLLHALDTVERLGQQAVVDVRCVS